MKTIALLITLDTKDQEAGFLKQQNSLILNLCNMHLEIEKIESVHLEVYGLQELMLLLMSMKFHILDL